MGLREGEQKHAIMQHAALMPASSERRSRAAGARVIRAFSPDKTSIFLQLASSTQPANPCQLLLAVAASPSAPADRCEPRLAPGHKGHPQVQKTIASCRSALGQGTLARTQNSQPFLGSTRSNMQLGAQMVACRCPPGCRVLPPAAAARPALGACAPRRCLPPPVQARCAQCWG